jgi:hypothetical protein
MVVILILFFLYLQRNQRQINKKKEMVVLPVGCAVIMVIVLFELLQLTE